jgi:hypothetical protein
MTVQIAQGRPKDRLNGLAALEAELLRDPKQTITAVVTYRVSKIVDDLKKDEEYPVVYPVAIEPILGELEQQAEDLQVLAHQQRTGETTLDFDDTSAGDDDADGE